MSADNCQEPKVNPCVSSYGGEEGSYRAIGIINENTV